MEKADIIAVVVVTVIAAAELLCLFLCSKLRRRSYPLCAALPVTAQDKELSQRLEYIASLIEDGSSSIDTVLLVNIGASQEQLQLCREFCNTYHAAELIKTEDMEEKLKKYLHFQRIYSII